MSDDIQKQMMEMMASMKATMDAQTAELAKLKQQAPTGPIEVDPTDTARREEYHTAQMRRLIAEMKDRFFVLFGQNEQDTSGEYSEDAVTPDVENRTQKAEDMMLLKFHREVIQQVMWSIASNSARQYHYMRYMADITYLNLSKVWERYDHQTRSDRGTLSPTLMEQAIDGNTKAYERAERDYDYYNNNMLPFEVLTVASREIWQEIVDDKEAEANAQDIEFKYPREPDADISEMAHREYIDNRANKQQAAILQNGVEALKVARLRRMTALAFNDDGTPTTK